MPIFSGDERDEDDERGESTPSVIPIAMSRIEVTGLATFEEKPIAVVAVTSATATATERSDRVIGGRIPSSFPAVRDTA